MHTILMIVSSKGSIYKERYIGICCFDFHTYILLYFCCGLSNTHSPHLSGECQETIVTMKGL